MLKELLVIFLITALLFVGLYFFTSRVVQTEQANQIGTGIIIGIFCILIFIAAVVFIKGAV